MRFLRVVMACVFDPLLLGVCLHAPCDTPFLNPIGFCCLLFIYFTLLFSLLFAS